MGDTIMDKAGEPLTKEQNDKITAHIVRKRCNQMMGALRTRLLWGKMVRAKRAEKRWKASGRVVSILGGTVAKVLGIVRQNILDKKKEEAVLSMQTFFRSCYERRSYVNKIEKVKKSVEIIKIASDAKRRRDALKQWMDVRLEQRKDEMDRLQTEDTKPQSVPQPIVQHQPTKPHDVVIDTAITIPTSREETKEEKQEEDQRLRDEINSRHLQIKRASDDLSIQHDETVKIQKKNKKQKYEETV